MYVHTNFYHQNRDGSTALYLSSHVFRPVITRMLLEAGADPSVMSLTGSNPVIYAAIKGFLV